MTKKVVKTLQKIIKDNDLKFSKYITIDYHHRVDNLDKVISDNKRLRYVIRKFYKSNIRFWFFTEVHRNGKLKGGFHRHILMEDCSPDNWKYRSNAMNNLILQLDPSGEVYFNCEFGYEPTVEFKDKLLVKAIRSFNKSIPNGKAALKVDQNYDDQGGAIGRVDYNMKDIRDLGQQLSGVIDWENSDCIDKEMISSHELPSILTSFNQPQFINNFI